MWLLRIFLLTAARHSFSFSAQHLPGVTNQIADALSRIRWQKFRRLAPIGSSSNSNPSQPADRLDLLDLEQQCDSFLTHSLAPSTQHSYASAQAKLDPSGSPCPTDEWMLCLFVRFLARAFQHLSIKGFFHQALELSTLFRVSRIRL